MPSASRQSSLKRVVRRAARSVLSPIDGRVADINRRVENVRASTESSLDAYAKSASESYSYIGVELRRLHDLLAEERSVHGNNSTRLARARDLPLEGLDESLAIVEVPFATTALSRLEAGARILDLCGADGTFGLSAASLGYEVTVIDQRPLRYTHPKLDSHASLVEGWDASPASFAAAFLISTIQNVGSNPSREYLYGSGERGVSADVELLDRVRGLLSPDGLLVLTVPYGTRTVTDCEHVYNQESLDRLLAAWGILERRIAVRRDALVWEASERIEDGARGVAMFIASPKQSH